MSCPMTVQTLLEGWCDSVPDVVIRGMSLGSRRIEPGHAFVAVAGGSSEDDSLDALAASACHNA